jgi:hypothetical protein
MTSAETEAVLCDPGGVWIRYGPAAKPRIGDRVLRPRFRLWADLGVSLSAREIEENQRELWKNFPREDI